MKSVYLHMLRERLDVLLWAQELGGSNNSVKTCHSYQFIKVRRKWLKGNFNTGNI